MIGSLSMFIYGYILLSTMTHISVALRLADREEASAGSAQQYMCASSQDFQWLLDISLPGKLPSNLTSWLIEQVAKFQAQAARDESYIKRAQAWTSEELEEEYTFCTGRSPPPGFARWVAFAKKNQCSLPSLGYQGIEEDLSIFRNLTRSQFYDLMKEGEALADVHLITIGGGTLDNEGGGPRQSEAF